VVNFVEDKFTHKIGKVALQKFKYSSSTKLIRKTKKKCLFSSQNFAVNFSEPEIQKFKIIYL